MSYIVTTTFKFLIRGGLKTAESVYITIPPRAQIHMKKIRWPKISSLKLFY